MGRFNSPASSIVPRAVSSPQPWFRLCLRAELLTQTTGEIAGGHRPWIPSCVHGVGAEYREGTLEGFVCPCVVCVSLLRPVSCYQGGAS